MNYLSSSCGLRAFSWSIETRWASGKGSPYWAGSCSLSIMRDCGCRFRAAQGPGIDRRGSSVLCCWDQQSSIRRTISCDTSASLVQRKVVTAAFSPACTSAPALVQTLYSDNRPRDAVAGEFTLSDFQIESLRETRFDAFGWSSAGHSVWRLWGCGWFVLSVSAPVVDGFPLVFVLPAKVSCRPSENGSALGHGPFLVCGRSGVRLLCSGRFPSPIPIALMTLTKG